jgi:hypothetical protein
MEERRVACGVQEGLESLPSLSHDVLQVRARLRGPTAVLYRCFRAFNVGGAQPRGPQGLGHGREAAGWRKPARPLTPFASAPAARSQARR